MFKSLLLIIIVALLVWAGRGFILRLQNKPGSRPTDKSRADKTMVQCVQCKTYIPTDDAIKQGEQNFCSSQHLQDWNKSA